ncbi:olfactory receptor 1361-like [Alligator sinensis]|uniref:Olfactory receptor n=1 Tax=Alligator sinensis TaxID=38654 RepID=A0A1U7SE57_ALLSI|nr:olfactory receptor 1361-like [Alligator sinensis]
MELDNQTIQTEFLLLGLLDAGPWQAVLFLVCLCVYLAGLVGNLLLVFLVITDSHLDTPMYFFLGNFSFLEICFTSVTVPRLLANTLASMKAISLPGCLLQVYFLHSMGCTECFLLAIMAFDRYLAIHRPLHYSTVMTRRLCVTLAATTWIACLLYSSLHSVILSQLSFCRRSQEIHHYFCDIPALLQAACSDVSLGKSMLHVAGMVGVVCPFAWTLFSYVLILAAILRIRSAQGRAKAFSTCTSHITMVLLTTAPS